jgi:hypothetical protein
VIAVRHLPVVSSHGDLQLVRLLPSRSLELVFFTICGPASISPVAHSSRRTLALASMHSRSQRWYRIV